MNTRLLNRLLLLTVLFSSCGIRQTPAVEAGENLKAQVSETVASLPALRMQKADGGLVNLESFRGKKVFLNLWATWCPPCRKEMPSIQQLYAGADTSKVAFVMLSLDDNWQKGLRYLRQNAYTLPYFYPAEPLPALLDVGVIPTTFIFDESGSLIRKIEGGEDYGSEAFKKIFQ